MMDNILINLQKKVFRNGTSGDIICMDILFLTFCPYILLFSRMDGHRIPTNLACPRMMDDSLFGGELYPTPYVPTWPCTTPMNKAYGKDAKVIGMVNIWCRV